MPYYVGGEIEDRAKLSVQTPIGLATRLNIDVRTRTEATSIDRGRKVCLVGGHGAHRASPPSPLCRRTYCMTSSR